MSLANLASLFLIEQTLAKVSVFARLADALSDNRLRQTASHNSETMEFVDDDQLEDSSDSSAFSVEQKPNPL